MRRRAGRRSPPRPPPGVPHGSRPGALGDTAPRAPRRRSSRAPSRRHPRGERPRARRPRSAAAWMGPEGPPAALQALAAMAEFGGGLAWTLGAFTSLASLGILATMLTGIAIAHLPAGDPLLRLTVKGVAEGPSGSFAGLPRWLVQTDGAIQ